MSYATEEYYSASFNKIPKEEVEKYLNLASEKIDDITFNRIVKKGFDKLTAFQKECVQKAICYQAEYYFDNGISSSINNVSSYNVLDISISIDKTKETDAQKLEMDELAYMHIKKSGLTTRSFRWL